MAATTYTDFPNPILIENGEDYIEGCSFNIICDEEHARVTNDDLEITVEYDLKSKSLTSLIDSGQATVAVHVNSPSVSYSTLASFKNSNVQTITIPKMSVKDVVRLTGYVVASEEIHRYEDMDELNKDFFEGVIFSFRKGDVLAQSSRLDLYIDDSEFEKPLTSVFRIRRAQKDEATHSVDVVYDDELVFIYLRSDLYDYHEQVVKSAGGALSRYVMGLTVLPALTEAIGLIKDSSASETYLDKRWCRSIVKRAEGLGVDIYNVQMSNVAVADLLLGEVVEDGLRSYQDFFESEVNSGESFDLGGVD